MKPEITPIHKGVLLSALWTFVMLNMLKADILSLYIPGTAEELLNVAGETPITLIMLIGSIIMELSLLMIILSYVLRRKANRYLNMLMSILTIAFIWGGMSTYPHYLFIASVETVALLAIFYISFKWNRDQPTN